MNLFDLFVRIGIEDEVSGKLPAIGDKLKGGLALAGKAAAVGVGAATTAMTALTKATIDSYAETEQLRGGVETLFQNSAKTVMAYADNAYKTAGMSANKYMDTVTSFSASLLQSLGGDTEAAAKYADQAITDMADNANKMGTDISMIQNAYQGFAKQNYTMLDNLKLGYGGTKEEMQRLLDDAEKISGIKYDLTSFADIVDAIHTVQEEMGVAGATAAEASETISGSVTAAKAAWANLVAGLADGNADLEGLTDNFISSVETAANNILPIVDRVIENLLTVLEEKGPDIVAGGAKLFGKIAAGAIQAIPVIISSIPSIIEAIVDGFKESDLDIVEIGKDIVRGIWQGISSLDGWIGQKVSGFFDGLFSGVKEHEQIHSPSKKWAYIGKNDALGFASGWDDEFRSVRDRINSGLNFGTASVDFASSGLGISSAGIVNGISSAMSGGGGGGTVILQLPDNTELARYYLPGFIDVAKANGTPIANPVMA